MGCCGATPQGFIQTRDHESTWLRGINGCQSLFPERIKTIQHAVLLVKVFLYSALLVTIILGGIGIMNVMLAAIRERTKEIGLRKAVGATEEMILSQFLFESVSISLTGAILGIFLGFISVQVLKEVFQTSPAYGVFTRSQYVGRRPFRGNFRCSFRGPPGYQGEPTGPRKSMRFE